jgi:acetyl esterase/lipase
MKTASMLGCLCLFLGGMTADAAEVKLLSAAVMKPVLGELAGQFQQASGHTLTIEYESAGVVRERVQAGGTADVAIIQRPVVDALQQQGKIRPGSVVTLARSGVAVAVRKGAPKPDIGSVEALKRTLLAARSIAYPDPAAGHASGIHFRGVLERLGIATEVNAKAKLQKCAFAQCPPEDHADIGITQPMEILATPGYELVGWLPAELQDYDRFTWAAGVTANASEPDAARALVRFLASPTAAGAIKRRGMEPVAPAALRPAGEPLAVRTRAVDYLRVNGQTFQATVYQPDGPGPFPAILDVHGGAWTREDVRRDEHAILDRALAAMGMVVVAVDFRQSPRDRYPASVADVNFAMRWLRANAATFNASPRPLGGLGSSSGGHLVLLNAMRPSDPRFAALPVAGIAPDEASPDYVIVVYPISDPLARRAYAQEVGNPAPVKSTDVYFSPSGSLEEGNPQIILDRRESAALPPVLLLQGSADANGVVRDKNVSPAIQQRFVASYRAAGGRIQLELLPGAPHNFANAAGANLEQALGLMKAFIGQRLAGH